MPHGALRPLPAATWTTPSGSLETKPTVFPAFAPVVLAQGIHWFEPRVTHRSQGHVSDTLCFVLY